MLGERIRAARKAAGISQAELARQIGVAAVTMWKFEVGRLRPGLDRLRSIATRCQVTLDSLMPAEAAELDGQPDVQSRRAAPTSKGAA